LRPAVRQRRIALLSAFADARDGGLSVAEAEDAIDNPSPLIRNDINLFRWLCLLEFAGRNRWYGAARWTISPLGLEYLEQAREVDHG
jgi:hypothetical protein